MSKGKFNTEELIQQYFKTKPESTVRKICSQIDRPELYDYEEKINKPLVEMDATEIAEMLFTFTNNSYSKNKYKISYRTYDLSLSILRGFFDWYIDNCKVIKNPCNDKRIKGFNSINYFKDSSMLFTKDSLEEAIAEIRNEKIEEYADYDEAILRMFYEGFSQSLEIVELKESDIDHDKQTVTVRGREWKISDRLYELLVKIHKMDEIPARHGNYLLLSYKGSYFKFPTRESFKDEFESRPPVYYASYISRIFNKDIRSKLDTNINARMLYLRGFYDYLIDEIGEEETSKMLLSIRDRDESAKLAKLARSYNLVEQNVTQIKKLLLPFIPK